MNISVQQNATVKSSITAQYVGDKSLILAHGWAVQRKV